MGNQIIQLNEHLNVLINCLQLGKNIDYVTCGNCISQ